MLFPRRGTFNREPMGWYRLCAMVFCSLIPHGSRALMPQILAGANNFCGVLLVLCTREWADTPCPKAAMENELAGKMRVHRANKISDSNRRWCAMTFMRTWVLFLSVWALAACSSYAPPSDLSGLTQSQLINRMGQPETQRTLADGSVRLEYPTGPYGEQTWFVDFDPAGLAIRSEQVLTEKNFNQIAPGMTQREVRERLGLPGEVAALARSRGTVWSYRYENTFCLWFQVEIASDGTVRSAGSGERPECDRSDGVMDPT